MSDIEVQEDDDVLLLRKTMSGCGDSHLRAQFVIYSRIIFFCIDRLTHYKLDFNLGSDLVPKFLGFFFRMLS